ncbi:MAG: zinc-dependent peptidase [Planctomycetes bacterium]|nr:zinc-dependent peptidase [Planctomycetota bacterium]
MFAWLRSRRRRAIGERPVPAAWREILRQGVRQLDWLEPRDTGRLLEWIAVFLEEKRFEGCRGFTITDEVKVTIAAQAGLVVLGFQDEWFDGLKSLLVYPGDYLVPRVTPLEGGGQLEWREARLGETWAGGSMVLSWPGVRAGGRLRDGPRSVVIHECAHLVDLLDGEIDGVPPLPAANASRWRTEMAACRGRFESLLDDGRSVAFDDYACESAAEFFAVASECFFQDPHRLMRQDAMLYGLLAEAYRQDPIARVPVRPARG